MDESVVKHLEQMAQTGMRLSHAIRLGIRSVPEAGSYCGCALGAAYTYKTGRNLDADQYLPANIDIIGEPCGYAVVARMFGVPLPIARHASNQHLSGRWSREQCADYLASQGY